MTLQWGKCDYLPFLPAGFLSWHRALWGPLTHHVCCFWKYRETGTPKGVSFYARKSWGTDINLDSVLVQNTLFYTDPWLSRVNRNGIEVVTRPDSFIRQTDQHYFEMFEPQTKFNYRRLISNNHNMYTPWWWLIKISRLFSLLVRKISNFIGCSYNM